MAALGSSPVGSSPGSAQFDDGGLAETLAVGEQGTVDEPRPVPVLTDLFLPPSAVDVAEDVELGPSAQHGARARSTARVSSWQPKCSPRNCWQSSVPKGGL